MIYTLAKAAHLISLFVWIGGMVAVAVSLRHPVGAQLKILRTYDHSVTSPAMIAAWGFGLFLAWQGGWYSQPWLWAKLALVLALSGIHGALSGSLRQYTGSENEPEPSRVAFLVIGFTLLVLIVLLVSMKPQL